MYLPFGKKQYPSLKKLESPLTRHGCFVEIRLKSALLFLRRSEKCEKITDQWMFGWTKGDQKSSFELKVHVKSYCESLQTSLKPVKSVHLSHILPVNHTHMYKFPT